MSTRAAQRGVSLIEALIMLALAGLVMSLLIPEIGRGVRADHASAVGSQEAAAFKRAEERFRTAVRFAARNPGQRADAAVIAGDDATLRVAPVPRRGQAWRTIGFEVVRRGEGGAIILVEGSRRETLVEWPRGSGGFSYFSAGEWRRQPGPTPPEMIRLAIGERIVWIEKTPPSPATMREAAMREIEGGGNLDR